MLLSPPTLKQLCFKICGWWSKLLTAPFGVPYISGAVPYYNRDPKRDHNFHNHPCEGLQKLNAELPQVVQKRVEFPK